jgi:hypothetical protein
MSSLRMLTAFPKLQPGYFLTVNEWMQGDDIRMAVPVPE